MSHGLALGWLVLLSACVQANFPLDTIARPAVDTPARFLFDASLVPDSIDVPDCRTPLVDPQDRSQITLVRSMRGLRGDYAVTGSRYGVGPQDLLRINCKTEAVVGIVPR
ncbi:MAG: hypothetical protein HY700_22195 [Gemmatimonadetes bacterium]|nr:hypothetical protein [Gemmatimonadota bacterium]